ncbi:hypothetical protein KF840_23050 [bacterium]|nr:hypothetical protein [bacterium]MBX3027783.1 hypothetical protein [bacterium]
MTDIITTLRDRHRRLMDALAAAAPDQARQLRDRAHAAAADSAAEPLRRAAARRTALADRIRSASAADAGDLTRWRVEHDELLRVERAARQTLDAILAGTADDGVAEDLCADVARRVEAGELSKDQARDILAGAAGTGRPRHGFMPARGM